MFYAKSTGGFYVAGIHKKIPSDAVEITAKEHAALLVAQSAGARIQSDDDGRPIAVMPLPAAPPKADAIEPMRLIAYADPLTGSDRYFAEAQRMQAMGDAGWEAVRDKGVQRYQEIQAEYPWPTATAAADGGANV